MTSNRHPIAQELKELLLRLPWWLGLLCALVAYLLLRPIASLRAPAPTGTLDTALTAVGQLFVGLAGLAQYLIPLAFVALAAVAAFLHWKRRDIYESLTSNPGGPGARGLSRDDVALLIAAAYRARGFQVRAATAGESLRGFDLQLRRGETLILLHLQNWKSSVLDAAPLLQIDRALEQVGADRALVLISGRFTPEAESFAADKPMDLIDGRGLKRLVAARPAGALAGTAEAIFTRLARWGDGSAHACAGDGGRRDPADDGAMASGADDRERALGTALAALIWDEPGSGRGLPDPTPGSGRPHVRTPRPMMDSAAAILTSQIHGPISIRRIVNLIGMSVVLGLIWMTYDWFDALPETPSDTPWALLGQDQSQPAKAYAELAAGLVAGERALPPLGQLDYGPEMLPVKTVETIRGTETYQEPPMEVFRSIRELEDAFNARYVPPPSCYDGSSPGGLASCGNHRIRARRAFIASNGRTMVPAEPSPKPPFASSHEPAVAINPAGPYSAWETDSRRRQSSDADAQDYPDGLPREAMADWRSRPEDGYFQPPRPDSSATALEDRYTDWWPPQAEDEAEQSPWEAPRESAARSWTAEPDAPQQPTSRGYWREEAGRGEWSGWVHREWRPGEEPPAESQPHGHPPRSTGLPETPTVRRLPVERWLPAEPGSVVTWREEQRLRDQGMLEDTWNRPRRAEPHGDWHSPGTDSSAAEPPPDWRRDWSIR
jgi:restriction system protein